VECSGRFIFAPFLSSSVLGHKASNTEVRQEPFHAPPAGDRSQYQNCVPASLSLRARLVRSMHTAPGAPPCPFIRLRALWTPCGRRQTPHTKWVQLPGSTPPMAGQG
jgi:hypothetical protein